MTEAPALGALCLAVACWFAAEKRQPRGGVLLLASIVAGGTACLLRPQAIFGILGCADAAILRRRRIGEALVVSLGVIAFAGIAIAAIHALTGFGLEGVRVTVSPPDTWDGHLFDVPLKSLVYHTLQATEGQVKNVYVWFHVTMVVATCVVLWRETRRQPADPLPLLLWLLGNSVFVACLGTIWAYSSLPRFTVMALPPVWIAMVRRLGGTLRAWSIVAAVSFGLAVMLHWRSL